MKRCPLCGRILTRLRKDNNEIVIRGLCPEDRDKLIRFYEQLSDETIYTRFFSIIRYFDPYVDKLVSSSGILAIVAEEASSGEIVGVAELVLDKEGRAEGGIIVLERMQGKGIGTAMALSMKELAKEYGIRKVYGYILADNIKALRLVKKLGGRPKSYYSSMIYVEIPVEDG
ncbi:MAG: GNAT family N-acetyltransferase [Desulfurococcales archaeon]|nr:GNAT family N-acetyltransferase [Desulfurococcales archaeon]